MEQTASLEKEDRLPFSSLGLRADQRHKTGSQIGARCIRGPDRLASLASRAGLIKPPWRFLQSAIAGRATVEEAHDAFVAFAKHAGVLVT